MSRENNIDNIFRDGLKNLHPAISEESRRQLQRRVFFLKFVRFNTISVQNVITVGAIASMVGIMTWATLLSDDKEIESIGNNTTQTEQIVAQNSSIEETKKEKSTLNIETKQKESNLTPEKESNLIAKTEIKIADAKSIEITQKEVDNNIELNNKEQQTISQSVDAERENSLVVDRVDTKQISDISENRVADDVDREASIASITPTQKTIVENKSDVGDLLPVESAILSQPEVSKSLLVQLPKRENNIANGSLQKDKLELVELSPSIMNGYISHDNKTYKARKYFKLGLPLPGIFNDKPEKYKPTRVYKNQWKSSKQEDLKKQASKRKKYINRKKLAAKSTNKVIASTLVEKDETPIRLFDIGLGFTPEWVFNAIDSDSKTAYNIDMKLSYQFEKLIIQSGLSLGFDEGENSFDIQYQQFLGTYEQLDSVTFYVDPSNGFLNTIYHTSEATVFDSVPVNTTTTIKKKYTYLRLPVLVGYEFNLSENFSLVPKVGAVVSFNIETEMPNTIWNPGVNQVNYINQTTASRKSTDWRLHASLALRYKLSDKFLLELEPCFRQTIGEMYDETGSSIKSPYTLGVGVGIIYRFNLKPEKP